MYTLSSIASHHIDEATAQWQYTNLHIVIIINKINYGACKIVLAGRTQFSNVNKLVKLLSLIITTLKASIIILTILSQLKSFNIIKEEKTHLVSVTVTDGDQ